MGLTCGAMKRIKSKTYVPSDCTGQAHDVELGTDEQMLTYPNCPECDEGPMDVTLQCPDCMFGQCTNFRVKTRRMIYQVIEVSEYVFATSITPGPPKEEFPCNVC